MTDIIGGSQITSSPNGSDVHLNLFLAAAKLAVDMDKNPQNVPASEERFMRELITSVRHDQVVESAETLGVDRSGVKMAGEYRSHMVTRNGLPIE